MHVRKALLILGLLAALAIPAGGIAATAPPSPGILCGLCGDGGTGFTGCTQQTESHSGSFWPFISIKHYLVVSYCKSNGWITSISIAVHGCDATGFAWCGAGPAWMTSGGVGTGYATFEAHASWILYSTPYISNIDVLTLTVPVG
jgi:hypothetical protein